MQSHIIKTMPSQLKHIFFDNTKLPIMKINMPHHTNTPKYQNTTLILSV